MVLWRTGFDGKHFQRLLINPRRRPKGGDANQFREFMSSSRKRPIAVVKEAEVGEQLRDIVIDSIGMTYRQMATHSLANQPSSNTDIKEP